MNDEGPKSCRPAVASPQLLHAAQRVITEYRLKNLCITVCVCSTWLEGDDFEKSYSGLILEFSIEFSKVEGKLVDSS
jgi:hypothetical protein